ncbi:MAG: family 43 glycosylhydrolase [Prevotella sp.]|nr:family 43 glycosylhydrolase [Prevotella sp.]
MWRDYRTGQMARDMTLFVDDDGKAYHVYASEENLTLQIAELNSDFTAHTGRYWRVAPAGKNEAPALFKHDGKYWLITSGCTGWAPNKARMFCADSLFGEWRQLPSPCTGPQADITFGAQSTFVQPLPDGRYLFMADIWRPKHPVDGRYVWLPIQFKADGSPVIAWQDKWKM